MVEQTSMVAKRNERIEGLAEYGIKALPNQHSTIILEAKEIDKLLKLLKSLSGR